MGAPKILRKEALEMNPIKALKEKFSGLWSRKGRKTEGVTIILEFGGREFSRVVYRGPDSRG